MKKNILILSLLLGLLVSVSFEYQQLLFFLKNYARPLFVILIVLSISANLIKSENQKFKDSIFNFLIILWASFWFLCFEASYVPLYAAGQCIKGEYFNHQKFSLELEQFKYSNSFGFMKYDISKFWLLREKYKTLENFHIVKKDNQGYYLVSQKGLNLFIPVYEDVNYEIEECRAQI